MTLKKKGCSACQISVKTGFRKPVAHTAVSYFNKLEIYWDVVKKGRPKKTSTGDKSMMKLTVKRFLTSSYKKNQFGLIKKKNKE